MTRTTTALDDEWNRHFAHSRTGRRALARWSESEPLFTAFDDLDEVLAARTNSERCEPLLRALAMLAPSDSVAARTLLQAMLPGLVATALRRFSDDPGAMEEITALAWNRIRTYPSTRSGPVALNISLDVAKHYLRDRKAARPIPEVLTDAPEEYRWCASAEDVLLAQAMRLEIERAGASGRISGRACELILRTRLNDECLHRVAVDLDTSYRTAQCIRRRAELRLEPDLRAVA